MSAPTILPFCSKTIGGDAGETATLISLESGVLEQAKMVITRTAANNARKKAFHGYFSSSNNSFLIFPRAGRLPSMGELAENRILQNLDHLRRLRKEVNI
jgi:hypothetical protein